VKLIRMAAINAISAFAYYKDNMWS